MPHPQQSQATPQAPPQQTLAQLVRGKYPGAYDDMDDPTLEQKVLAKYPEYSDLPRTQAKQPPTPEQSAAAAGPATGIGPQRKGVLPWLQNFEGDVRHGTDTTGPGKVLKALGATGVNEGSQAGAGDFAASPILGVTRAAQGAARLPWQPWQGTKDIVSGALQAGQIPLSFLGQNPTPGGAGKVVEGASALASKIPNAERAGQTFQQVSAAVGNHSVPMTDALSDSIMGYRKLVDAGGSRSMSVEKLLQRVTNPDKGPLTYDEARLFQSNISRLSADEAQRLTPVMKRAVGQIAGNLSDAVSATAESGGKLQQFQGAMKEYRQAMQLKDFTGKVGDAVKNDLVKGVGYAAGGAAGGYALKKVLEKK